MVMCKALSKGPSTQDNIMNDVVNDNEGVNDNDHESTQFLCNRLKSSQSAKHSWR